MKRRKTKKVTTIAVHPGVDIVVQPGASTLVVDVLQSIIKDQREPFLQELIADVLGENDRYEIASLLMKEPERLEQIAKLIREGRAA